MRVIVSDTSPLRYLILIGQASLLERLYQHVSIPEAVAHELQAEATPELVRRWMNQPPSWLEIIPPDLAQSKMMLLPGLDAGEREAILLALRLKADLVLMDERTGVQEARKLGLTVIGTLGVLARGAEHGWLDFRSALNQLQQTNFRVHPKVLRDLLEIDSDRQQH